MSTNQDQEEFNTLVQHNRLLRRTYRKTNEELQALHHILQQKQQRSVPTDHGWVRPMLPNSWLIQGEDHLHTPEELQSLKRSNDMLHQLNATLAQLQMTTFKKLVDVTRPEKRPDKQTQTTGEWQNMKSEAELQQEEEELQKELDQLNFEMCLAKTMERISLSRYNSLNFCVKMMELHNKRMRRLLEQVMESPRAAGQDAVGGDPSTNDVTLDQSN